MATTPPPNPNTQQTNSPLGSGAPPNIPGSMGVPNTTAGATFELEEQAAAAARGQTYASLWAGFTIPPAAAGDFWTYYSMAETFASNTGWKYLPTPQMILELVKGGNMDQQAVFSWMATMMKVPASMPWASLGMNSTTYKQTAANQADNVYALTGETSFADAGLAAVEQTAMFNGWTQQHLQNYIQQNPALSAKYGYLKYEMNYQQFQNYKVTNASALKERYGNSFTDQQAVANLGDPLSTFHAEGSAFGQFTPYVQSSQKMPTGFASAAR